MPRFVTFFDRLQRHREKEQAMSCYWLCIHFTSAEEVAGFYLEHKEEVKLEYPRVVRMLRGGEKVPMCPK